MLLSSFVSWWYGPGWGWLLGEIRNRLRAINEIFSVGILLRTLFSPWKQIKTPSNFHNFLQAAIDNTVSRFIGAIVRIGLLLAALACLLALLSFGLALLVLWPLLPLSVFIFPLLSITGAGV